MITRGVSEPEAFEDYAKDWAGIGIMPRISSRISSWTSVWRVVLCVEMCEVSELSELSPLSEAASHRRGYVSSFWNFSDAGERSGKVIK
jgi:hypothetical protein